MAASLFGTGGSVNVNVNGTLVPQSFVATDGQTVFNLSGWTYTPNTNSLLVFINGQRQVVTRDFTETSTSSFTLIEGCVAGDFVDVIGFPEINLTAVNAGSVIIGGAYSVQQYVTDGEINLKGYPFLAVGDGVTDDTAAVTAFLAACSGKKAFIPAGTYKITSLISPAAIANTEIIGVRGLSKFTGSFGYALIQFSALTNVKISNLVFESTYINPALSGNTAILYAGGCTWNNVEFTKNKFSVTNANTSAICMFARTSAPDTSGSIDNLLIEDNDFDGIGSTAITLMNRGSGATDKYQAARRVTVRNNRARNLGTQNSFGMFISLDGYGSAFHICDNVIENHYGTGIENTGWWFGDIQNNTFRADASHTKKWRAIVLEGVSWGGLKFVQTKNNTIQGNATIGSYAWACTHCSFDSNIWTFTEAAFGFDEAFALIDSNYCNINADRYISDDKYALRVKAISADCKHNKFSGVYVDTSTATADVAALNFDGANCSKNVFDGYIIKGATGVLWNQTTSAVDNLVGYRECGTWVPGITFAVPGDLNVVASSAQGRFTREGRLCTVSFEFDTSTFTFSTASGNLRITGLPFAASSPNLDFGPLGAFQGVTKAGYTQLSLRTVASQTYLGVYASGSAQVTAQIQASDMPSGGTVRMYGSITYIVA